MKKRFTKCLVHSIRGFESNHLTSVGETVGVMKKKTFGRTQLFLFSIKKILTRNCMSTSNTTSAFFFYSSVFIAFAKSLCFIVFKFNKHPQKSHVYCSWFHFFFFFLLNTIFGENMLSLIEF